MTLDISACSQWTRHRPRGQVTLIAILCLANVIAFGAIMWLTFRSPSGGIRVSSSGPTITQLERLGELVALKVCVADVLEAEGEGYRGSWLVKGDALISVDLRGAKIVDNDEKNRRATIVLPAIKVIQPRVNHEKTKTWDVQKTTWIPFAGHPDRLRDSAMVSAQNLVESAAHLEETMDSARENAVLILKNMYRLTGWEVEVTWSDKACK